MTFELADSRAVINLREQETYNSSKVFHGPCFDSMKNTCEDISILL